MDIGIYKINFSISFGIRNISLAFREIKYKRLKFEVDSYI